MDNPIFSIIIPHKNCPHLLNRCLDSIPDRKDIQIIVIDDCSDCDKKPRLSREDVFLILLDKDHSNGAGRARNIGIDKAKGKWLLFPDADDYYTNNLSSLLDKYAGKEDFDMVFFKSMMVSDNGVYKPLEVDRLVDNYLKRKRGAENDLRYGFFPLWSRMVRRDIIIQNKLLFEELPSGNDVKFGLDASFFSTRIAVENTIIYNYYKWPNGSITERRKEGLVEEHLVLRGKLIAYYKQLGYHNSFNLLSVVESLLRAHKITASQSVKYYRKYLHEYHISCPKDIACYFYELLVKRILHRIVMAIEGR